MKRFTALLILPLIAITGYSVVFSPAPVSAQTQKQADQCYKDWHKVQFYNDEKSNKQREKYNKTKCDEGKGGNCSPVRKGEGSFTFLEVKCGKKPGTFPGKTGDDVAPIADAHTDPAVAMAARCYDDNCGLIEKYANPLINLLSALVGIAVVIGIIWGAIEVTMSAGDPQKSASGKNHIRNALIGAVGYVLLYAFLQWIIPGGI